MIRKSICVFLILVWIHVTSCNVGTEKLFQPGSSVVFASKTTSGNAVRIQLELFVTSSDRTVWQTSARGRSAWHVDLAMMNAQANDSLFGTSYRNLATTTLYTLETSTLVQSVNFISINEDNVATLFVINMKGEDGTTHYNISTCRPSFSEISETSVNAAFSCIPELDPKDAWYMNVGVFGTFESDTSEVVEISMLDERRKTKYVNLTLERGTTAKANIVGSKDIIKKIGDFLFLYSSLTFYSSGVVASTLYSIVHDVSKTKTEGEFKFLHFRPNIALLEGEPFTVVCDAMGRDPPPITVYKDGRSIKESEADTQAQMMSQLWSSSYVTYRHASKKSTGNYSCVAENNGKKLISPKYTEVILTPRIRWDLCATLENDPSLIRVSIVVEGAIDVLLNCNTDGNREDNLTLSRVKTTAMSKWNERVEAEYTWRTDQFYSLTHLSCVVKDKNDEILFDYNV